MPKKAVAEKPTLAVVPTKLKIPDSLGAAADLFYVTRERRIALEREAARIKEDENALEDYIINTLPKSDANGITGTLCRVTIKVTPKPTVTDWDKLYKFITKTKNFALLHRRVTEETVREYWDNGKVIPGVGAFNVVKLSVAKR